jgi:hypothetical protein
MDIDLGPVFLAILVLYGIAFLIGFGVFFIATTLLTRTWRRSHPNYKYLTAVVITGVSIFGGMLNLNLINQWYQQERAKFVKQRQAFIDHIEQEYQILDLQYQDEQEKPFTLVFTVPYDGKYWLTIIGYIADDSYHGYNSMEYVNRVVYIIEPHTFTKGTQEYTFGFNAGISKEGIELWILRSTLFPMNLRKHWSIHKKVCLLQMQVM